MSSGSRTSGANLQNCTRGIYDGTDDDGEVALASGPVFSAPAIRFARNTVIVAVHLRAIAGLAAINGRIACSARFTAVPEINLVPGRSRDDGGHRPFGTSQRLRQRLLRVCCVIIGRLLKLRRPNANLLGLGCLLVGNICSAILRQGDGQSGQRSTQATASPLQSRWS